MLKELNNAMDYIEEHLQDELRIEEIAEYVHVPDCHFRKVFQAITNMTLNEYIKCRKLSEAGKELLNGASITDLAYKYGYQSVDGFSRAFKKWSGLLPSQAAKERVGKFCPKLDFIVTVKGGKTMEYRIVDMPAFVFAGVCKRVPMQFEGVNESILQLANSITAEQRCEMHRLQNIEPRKIVNVSYESDTNFMEESGELTHMIGILTTCQDVKCGLSQKQMEAQTWAVFPNEGPFPAILQSTMAKIYSEWLVTADYVLAESLSFSFTQLQESKENYAYSEIWIPVKKKNNT